MCLRILIVVLRAILMCLNVSLSDSVKALCRGASAVFLFGVPRTAGMSGNFCTRLGEGEGMLEPSQGSPSTQLWPYLEVTQPVSLRANV